MKRIKFLFYFVALLLILSVVSCGNQATPTLGPTATAHTYPPPMNNPDDISSGLPTVSDDEPQEAPTEAPVIEPTEEVAAEPLVDNCVACHTNQQMLIDTADPVEEVVSENEGEG